MYHQNIRGVYSRYTHQGIVIITSIFYTHFIIYIHEPVHVIEFWTKVSKCKLLTETWDQEKSISYPE